MAARVRRDVQSLMAEGGSASPELEAYARAIESMQALDPGPGDPADPRSWRFQAAIHGYPGVLPSIDHPNRWGSCRHSNWFFLAWHRIYLFFFERVVQSHLEDETWSLPYWDYTKPEDSSSQLLPEPFRTPTTGNPLHVAERDPEINDPDAPEPVPAPWWDASIALGLQQFTVPAEDPDETFGGGKVANVAPNAGTRGRLELQPHGLVHSAVGGDAGLMSRFETAGLDPIFWLHHANLDRLLDVWIGIYGADVLPTDRAFLETTFEFFDGDGQPASLAVGDVLMSTDLGYEYESTAPPAGVLIPEPIPEFAATGGDMANPELLGAASDVPLARRSTVGISLASAAPSLSDEAAPSRWLLRVEDVAGQRTTPAYEVYLNLPEGEKPADHPERRAGTIASFGIPEATQQGSEHGGIGLTDVFDVTGVVQTLQAEDDWDDGTIAVTVVPVGLKGEVEDGGDVRAGRISLYAG